MKTLDRKSNFLGIEKSKSDYKSADIVVLPVPYERTVSYGGGTRLGPRAILEASHYVEFYDEELDRELTDSVRIATVPPVDLRSLGGRKAIDRIGRTVRTLLDDGKFVATLGGEHTISSAPIRAYFDRYPDLSVLHIDAHSDLRQEYEGDPYSHASVMARVCDFLDPSRLVQVAIRAQCAEEAAFIRERGVNTFYAYALHGGKFDSPGQTWQDAVCSKLTGSVYVSFDVDGLDPSVMPATGTPEPDGLTWHEAVSLLRKAGERSKIVGCDVVEFAPIKGLHHASETAAKLLYTILNYSFRNTK